MRDAAAAAAMSDPENNRWFRRRWSENTVQSDRCSPTFVEAPASTASSGTFDQDLTRLGHDLLRQWRRERSGEEAAR